MGVLLPAIGALLGHYRILEHIGQGGMGVVFRARDEQLERDVALKILPPEALPTERARKRFRREARVLAKLNHPNVAMAFDYGHQDDVDYLVTEYVDGLNLDTKLANGALPQKTVIQLGTQLARGLTAAHRAHIIHRDLKPSNLRLTNNSELKILDFGLACWKEPPADLAETLSQESEAGPGGTLPYMAPEQIRCEELDARTDIWGAGAVLYEMAAGKRPFPMASRFQLIDAIRYLTPPAPSTLNHQITPSLDAVILKALDKDPDRRYQSADELGVDLARLLPTTGPGSHVPIAEFARPKAWMRRITWILVMLAVSACAYGTYRLLAKWTKPQPDAPRLLTILPFDSSGQDEKTSAFLVGLNETLTAKLARGQDLQVISARDVREQGVKTGEQARREFGADLVLEGNAHRVGDMIRINCSLVDSKTHRQLTARTITSDAKDAFGLEDQVVNEIVSLLTADQAARTQTPPPVRRGHNAEAYASYLRGRGYLSEYQKPENIQLAIAEFKNATVMDPQSADGYAGVGEAYLLGYQQANRTGDWVNQAERNCERSLATQETAEGHICLGDVYHLTGKDDLAAQEFQEAVRIDPRNEDAMRGEADAYLKLGNAAAAEAAYQKAISLKPNYWAVYSWLGTFYYNQARYDDAIAQFSRVIELAPANYRGYSNLGAMYVAQGKYIEGLGPLNKSIEIRPNFEALNNLGNAYFQLRRFSEAADAFQRGLNLDDSDWLLWGNLGDSLFWSGERRPQAKATYERAIALADKKLDVNPKDTTVLAFLADYNAMSQHRQKAIDQIEQALALAPEDGEVRLRAAIVYNQFGDTERCLGSLEKAVSLGYSAQVIRDTPDFDHLHSNPRFKMLGNSH
jgi:tetratricopeptide (TPR) repeat protein/predicted Ser/Thr protein kinase